MFLSHIDVSLSLCLSLSLKAMKTMSFLAKVRLKNKRHPLIIISEYNKSSGLGWLRHSSLGDCRPVFLYVVLCSVQAAYACGRCQRTFVWDAKGLISGGISS